MEHYDSQLAARVWQRVQEGYQPAQTPAPDLSSLIQAEYADLSRYRQLITTSSSAQKQLLRQLILKTQACISTMNGIAFLLTDTIPEAKSYPLPKELPVSSLRRCYGGTLQRISQYKQWRSHPEFAPGFQKLAHWSEERCVILLQILGI